jgi:excisionase family DNA binding protein
MKTLENIERPTKKEQEAALVSYNALSAMLDGLDIEAPEIEIEETQQKIKIPLRALKLLATILEATSKGQPISIVPVATELTTQAAAEMLGCSRPHFVTLLESGEIPFTKVGKHRRVRFEDVRNYKNKMRQHRKEILVEMMQGDEEYGLYDS